jgi:hypothetical protein
VCALTGTSLRTLMASATSAAEKSESDLPRRHCIRQHTCTKYVSIRAQHTVAFVHSIRRKSESDLPRRPLTLMPSSPYALKLPGNRGPMRRGVRSREPCRPGDLFPRALNIPGLRAPALSRAGGSTCTHIYYYIYHYYYTYYPLSRRRAPPDTYIFTYILYIHITHTTYAGPILHIVYGIYIIYVYTI